MKKKTAKKNLPKIKTKKPITVTTLGTKAAIAKFDLFVKSAPEVVIGTEHDSEGKWYCVAVPPKGYMAFEVKSDRDDMAHALSEVIGAVHKKLDATEEDLSDTRAQLGELDKEVRRLKRPARKKKKKTSKAA